jgi:ribose transport system ATP-binding protein
MLPEDRKLDGLLLTQPITTNVTLARLDACSHAGWLRNSTERRLATEYVADLDVRCNSVAQAARLLSGGNQQKVLLARWLLRDCRVLLCDEPTRGIDVTARAIIYSRLDQLARAGKAILIASSDLEELMMLCDRIAVISAGRIAAVFTRGEWTEDRIMTAAFSGYTGQRQKVASAPATDTHLDQGPLDNE